MEIVEESSALLPAAKELTLEKEMQAVISDMEAHRDEVEIQVAEPLVQRPGLPKEVEDRVWSFLHEGLLSLERERNGNGIAKPNQQHKDVHGMM